MRTTIFAGIFLAIVSIAAAQEQAVVPQVELTLSGSPVNVQLPRFGGFLGTTACDKNGAIYLRPQVISDPNTSTLASSPVLRINSDGTTNKFIADQGNGVVAPHVLGQTIDADGHVYLITMRPGPGTQLTILELSADSSFASKTDLDRELYPGVFAVLPDGEFLVGGIVTEGDKDAKTTKSVLWLFGNDGRYKRQFLSASEPAPKNATGAKTKPATTTMTLPEPTRDFNSLQVGDDGNVYVLQSGAVPKLTVFDQGGKKLHTFKLAAPAEAHADPTLYISNGRLMLPYWKLETVNGKRVSKRIYRVYDSQTGDPMVDYIGTFRGLLACMDNNDLVYLVPGEGGNFAISRAAMR